MAASPVMFWDRHGQPPSGASEERMCPGCPKSAASLSTVGYRGAPSPAPPPPPAG